MVSRRASLLLVALAVVAVASAVLAGSSTTSYTYSGGLPFCTQCGGTSQYACSSGVGTWKNQYQVASPVPTGSVATSVSVTLLGSYACNYTPNVVEIDINDVPVNILQTTSDQACACNTCDGPVTFTSDYAPFGLPNFKYSGNNNVTINIMAGTICLNLVNITISWDTPTLPGTSTAIHRWNVVRYSSPRVCNTFGYDNSNQISLTFQDPLPSGALVLLANVQVFGSYWCYSSSSISPTITATLVSATISSIKLAAKGSSAKCNYSDQCDGGYWLPSSPMYQTGWPNYRYGASNTLRIDTTYYPRIGQVALYLTYYIPGSDAAPTTIVAPLSSE